jgi:hypothetical protein
MARYGCSMTYSMTRRAIRREGNRFVCLGKGRYLQES